MLLRFEFEYQNKLYFCLEASRLKFFSLKHPHHQRMNNKYVSEVHVIFRVIFRSLGANSSWKTHRMQWLGAWNHL